MSLMETKHKLLSLIAISFAVALAGCSSQRDVNIEVALDTADSSITIDGVHFSAATSMMGASKTARPPELESDGAVKHDHVCLLYTSPSPRDQRGSRMPSSA